MASDTRPLISDILSYSSMSNNTVIVVVGIVVDKKIEFTDSNNANVIQKKKKIGSGDRDQRYNVDVNSIV